MRADYAHGPLDVFPEEFDRERGEQVTTGTDNSKDPILAFYLCHASFRSLQNALQNLPLQLHESCPLVLGFSAQMYNV